MTPTQSQDPLSIFLYALKAPETKSQYPRRLKVFLEYLKLEGPLEDQTIEFLTRVTQNPHWLQLFSYAVYIWNINKGIFSACQRRSRS